MDACVPLVTEGVAKHVAIHLQVFFGLLLYPFNYYGHVVPHLGIIYGYNSHIFVLILWWFHLEIYVTIY